MNVTPKSTQNEPESPTEKAETSETSNSAFTTMMLRGLERLADLQKLTLEALNSQTKDISSTVRDVLRVSPAAPGTVFLDLTEQAVEEWTNAQKTVVDLMAQQSADALKSADAGAGIASQSAAAAAELLRRSAERAITAQEITLAYAVLQQAGIAEVVKRQTGVDQTPFAAASHSMQRGLESVMEKQREFLGEAAKAFAPTKL
jgi:hypothetical protein